MEVTMKNTVFLDVIYCNDFKHIFNDYNDYVSSHIIVLVFIILLLLLHRYDMTIVFILGHMTSK
jgi:hypothetical protein